MFEHANKQYNNARANVEDNIIKQAKSVMKPAPGDFERFFGDLYAHAVAEEDDDKIQDRISEYEARKYMDMWTKIKTGFHHEKTRLTQLRAQGGASPEDQAKMSKILDVSAEEQINLQKDLLFIESGEDVEDIFLSFKFYKLE